MELASLAFLSILILIPLLVLAFLHIILRPRPVNVPIRDRHVFITGGSSGIGLALAHHAAFAGAQVSILARNRVKLDEAKAAILLATGTDVKTFSVDIRDYEAVKNAIDEAGPVDVLVCNHGVVVPREIGEIEMDEVKFMIDVNLVSTFHLIKAALPGLKGRRDRGPGSISIMSSQAGQVGIYGYTAYSASKFGLKGLAEALQQEVIVDDIHVSIIFPPDTETPGFVEETKQRPELTSIIAESSGAMKADEVAKKTLDGIKSGNFVVPINFEGYILSIATVGLSPQRSTLMAFVETYDKDCETAINEQINVKYNVSYVYHAMYAYFDRDNVADLTGLAKFFKNSSVEEREHAEKLMEYQNKRGGKVKLQSIVTSVSEFDHAEKGDALYAMELALSLEKLVNEKLLNLHAVGSRSNDVQLTDFIESEFLHEQLEAIKKIYEYVSQLRRKGKGHGGLAFLSDALGK